MQKGNSKDRNFMIYAAAIHEINKAFKGKRLLSTYGFKLPKQNYVKPQK